MSFQDQPLVAKSNPDALRFVMPKQSLQRLIKWRRKWAEAQRRGVKQKAAEPDEAFFQRQLDFKQRCSKSISEIDRAMGARHKTAVRCALPKKQQRALGILPPVTYGTT